MHQKISHHAIGRSALNKSPALERFQNTQKKTTKNSVFYLTLYYDCLRRCSKISIVFLEYSPKLRADLFTSTRLTRQGPLAVSILMCAPSNTSWASKFSDQPWQRPWALGLVLRLEGTKFGHDEEWRFQTFHRQTSAHGMAWYAGIAQSMRVTFFLARDGRESHQARYSR